MELGQNLIEHLSSHENADEYAEPSIQVFIGMHSLIIRPKPKGHIEQKG